MTLTTFSKQQLEAATKIITLFVSIVQWVVLRAQMQSGKTGTFLFVAAEMLRERKVKKVIIMCGNGEKALKKQLKDELSIKKDEVTFLKRYQMYLVNVIGMSGCDLIDTIASIDLNNNIQIRCGADLDTKNDHLMGEIKDTLFIWEESHHAAGKTNRPNKFLKRMGISADGNPMHLEGEGKNNYVLSVSATPFAEVSDVHHEAQHKQIVDLQPGDGYRGVAYYLNKIISFADWSVTLPEILRQYAAEGGSAKYALIRVNGDKDMDKARKIAEENGWAHKTYDAKTADLGKKTSNPSFMLSWNELKVAPLQNTIIFIRNLGRMGQVLPKDYLRFVMETARNPKTDTSLQALLGRVCGYHTFNIDVYLSSKIVDSTELDIFVAGGVPSKAAHMSKARETVFDAFPIVLRGLVEDQADPDYLECSADKTRAFVKNGILTGNGVVRNDNGTIHSADIRRQIASAETHVTVHDVCKPNVNISYASVPALFKGILAGTQVKKAVRSLPSCGLMSDGKEVNAWVFKTNKYESLGFKIGTIIVQAACKMTADGESGVPKTTGKEAFTSKQEDGTEVLSNGSCALTISPATATSVSAMQTALDELVRMSLQKREAVTMSRCIASNQDARGAWQGILMNDAVSQALKKSGEIYKFIKIKHGVMLKVTGVKGRTTVACKATGLKRFSKIDW
jgi:hypothetical protein